MIAANALFLRVLAQESKFSKKYGLVFGSKRQFHKLKLTPTVKILSEVFEGLCYKCVGVK